MPDTDFGSILLRLARAAIAHRLGLGPAPAVPEDPRLHEKGATFITLLKDGELRGCIGSLRRSRELGEDVIANAVAAAMEDTRFGPLGTDEFSAITIEVSVLSEPEFLDFFGEEELLAQLRPGEDGLIIFSGCRSATFLPQVWDQLPEPRQFLAALKHKAGLPMDREVVELMAARYHVQKWKETEQEAS
ncbi:AmmeMemoRadiSam system protein A [Thauera sp. WH-2]|jgi:AmmeMemoRadiSam system protein A|uniref:AmmeMemoRadiSam system protein A n=1 Tax=unclassified Thauera TaxID=2609274 RepID=UPI002A41A1B9|nr:AmmeMemoRadiSam system protein A [Thauera sp.]